MSLSELSNALPAYAHDQKANLATLVSESFLSDQQKWGCLLVSAYAAGVSRVTAMIERAARERLTPEAIIAARQAASILAMNAVYFRAINLLQNHDLRGAPSNLAMSALKNPGVDKIDFELWALSISAVLGCGACLNAHESELHKRSVSPQVRQAALRIAATISAIAMTLRTDDASRS